MTDTTTIYTNPQTLAAAVVEMLENKGIGTADQKMWDLQECADFLGCVPAHVEMLVRESGLPCRNIACKGAKRKKLRFLPSAVVAWAGGDK